MKPKTAFQIAKLRKRSDGYTRTTLSTHPDAPASVGFATISGKPARVWDFDQADAFFARYEQRALGRHKAKDSAVPLDLPDDYEDDDASAVELVDDDRAHDPDRRSRRDHEKINGRFLALLAAEKRGK